jgi:microcystin-dependent protein
MDKNNIIFIIIFVVLIYIIYRLPSVEKMTNIDKATEDKIREIYKIDTDAIRNLSNLAKDLTVNGKLTVPGGLDIKGKLDVNSTLNFLPRGVIVAWTGTSPPTGWALCDGGNGTPDLRGRFILGLGHGSGLTNRTINQRDGAETHTLTVTQIPAHNHTMNNAGNHNHDRNWNLAWGHTSGGSAHRGGNHWQYNDTLKGSLTTDSGNHTHTINNTGGGQAHNNMPPYHVLAYIMRL